MTLEQALIAAVVALSGAVVALWKFYTGREEKIHERHRKEVGKLGDELGDARREFTTVLIKIAGIEEDDDE